MPFRAIGLGLTPRNEVGLACRRPGEKIRKLDAHTTGGLPRSQVIRVALQMFLESSLIRNYPLPWGVEPATLKAGERIS